MSHKTFLALITKIFSFEYLLLASLLLIGTVWTVQYLDLPIVRNSILFGNIIQSIETHGLWSATDYAYNKPLGFTIFALPFTELFGVNVGLKFASWLATALWCIVVYVFLKQMANRSETNPTRLRLALLISLFSPLLIYQFYSAYSDTLFASLFLSAILFLDRALSRNATQWDGIICVGLTLLSIWVKHHGFVLLPIFAIMMFIQRQTLYWQWQHARQSLLGLITLLVILCIVLIKAQQGMIPLFNLGKNVNNFLGGDNRLDIIMDNIDCLVVYLLLCFSVLLPLLFHYQYYSLNKSLAIILSLFIIPILYYKGTIYNIRYFIAITPILAWIIAGVLINLTSKIRRTWVILFIVVNSFTLFYYNSLSFNEQLRPLISLPKVDNLRLTSELATEQQHLQLIKDFAPHYNNTLVFLSRYYKKGAFHVWEKAGLLPSNITVYYDNKWRHEMLDKLNLRKAIIYEYVGFGSEKAKVDRDKKIRHQVQRITPRLFLLDTES